MCKLVVSWNENGVMSAEPHTEAVIYCRKTASLLTVLVVSVKGKQQLSNNPGLKRNK